MLYIALDIDGVISQMPDKPTAEHAPERIIDGYPVRIQDDVPDMVEALKNFGQVVFFSMWNKSGPKHIGPLVGLEDADFWQASWQKGRDEAFDIGWSPEQINNMFYAKTPLLPRYVSPEDNVLWFDDMVSPYDVAALEHIGFSNVRLVAVDPNVGLTWNHVALAADVADFLNSIEPYS